MAEDIWQVFAVRYAHHEREARDNFVFADAVHDGSTALDFFVWLVTNGRRSILVDLGFDHAGAARRGRELIRLPSEGIRLLGVDPATIEDVIITHLHYDHCGNLDDFPHARLFLQDREMQYATGRFMTHRTQRMPFDVEYVTAFVRAVYDERVVFVDGVREIAPGLSVHHVGGHTDGLQVVRVRTAAGWLVLASDAAHLYANVDLGNPFPIAFNLGEMLDGFGTLRSLADREELIVPGHDPRVFERFPAAETALAGEVIRLDQGPL